MQVFRARCDTDLLMVCAVLLQIALSFACNGWDVISFLLPFLYHSCFCPSNSTSPSTSFEAPIANSLWGVDSVPVRYEVLTASSLWGVDCQLAMRCWLPARYDRMAASSLWGVDCQLAMRCWLPALCEVLTQCQFSMTGWLPARYEVLTASSLWGADCQLAMTEVPRRAKQNCPPAPQTVTFLCPRTEQHWVNLWPLFISLSTCAHAAAKQH